MTVNNSVDQTISLLIIPADRECYFVSSSAFQSGQGPRRAFKKYEGAIVVAQDGRSRTIESVEVRGLWGRTLAQRILSALTSAWEIETRFSQPRQLSMSELKDLLGKNLSLETFNSTIDDPEELKIAVREADDPQHLFRMLGAPSAEDALDVL